MKNIVHLTSAHPRYDVRIYIKECKSLAEYFSVSLIVADNKGNEKRDNIAIYDVGLSSGRKSRILNTTKRVLKKAIELDADIYHLHDPELLLIAKKLKKRGKKVIFDAHEDLPKQILSKPYLKPWQSICLSSLVSLYEKHVCSKLHGIITATPSIRDKFMKINENVVDINNYPLLDEFYFQGIDWSSKQRQVCYIGGITKNRGVLQLVEAMTYIKEKALVLVGRFSQAACKKEAVRSNAYKYVIEKGELSRNEVKEIMVQSMAGLVTFLPLPNHINSQPNKMFEYMSAGIPVIGSNFSLWREIIEGNNCGICVDPNDPKEIAEAIMFMLDNFDRAEEMGRNGRKAIEAKYNWQHETAKLIQFYRDIN
jgi:glycosyltransferase involved in cell wall biosynthesis